MVDNQHKKITGYRDLSLDEIELMNEAKALAEQCGNYIYKISQFPGVIIDPRWLSIGRTELQQGFMAIIRSIAKPTSF